MRSTQGIYARDNRVDYCTIINGRVVDCGSKEAEREPLFATMNKVIDEYLDLVVYNADLDEKYFITRSNFQGVILTIEQFASLCGLCNHYLEQRPIAVPNPEWRKSVAFWLAVYGQLLLALSALPDASAGSAAGDESGVQDE